MKGQTSLPVVLSTLGFALSGAPARGDDAPGGRHQILVAARVGAASLLGDGGGPAAEAVGEWRYSPWVTLGGRVGYWSAKRSDAKMTATSTDLSVGTHAKIFLVDEVGPRFLRAYVAAGPSLHLVEENVAFSGGRDGLMESRASSSGTGFDGGFGIAMRVSDRCDLGGDVSYHAVKAPFGRSALTTTVGAGLLL